MPIERSRCYLELEAFAKMTGDSFRILYENRLLKIMYAQIAYLDASWSAGCNVSATFARHLLEMKEAVIRVLHVVRG